MSDNAVHTPLEAIEALESATFRMGQALRQVLAEHPGLPIRTFHPSVRVDGYLDEQARARASVEISARDVNGVEAWAKALGGEPEYRTHTVPNRPFLHADLTVTLGGTAVRIYGTRPLTDAETAALPAEQQADADAEAGGEAR
ncbi:hypothetical protein U5640_36210 [Streptomyces sp. SS7]|uniref:hypothetical protein n=1 Tax=Streptomyces sp. SS7 TaxID=3108485 RepID=UPI0030EE3CF8